MMLKENDKLEDAKSGLQIFSTNSKYLKLKRGNSTYYLDPTKYEISSLMMLLDISKLNRLEGEFNLHKDGIEKQNFIELMVKELRHEDSDKLNLVYGLYKLFLEIDFNGDEHMQWEEFTQFIIDTVMGENEVKDEDEDEVVSSGKDMSEKQLMKFKRYNVSTQTEDRYIHDTEIIDACFAPKIDTLFVVEYKTTKLKLYNPRIGKIDYTFDLAAFFKKESLNNNNDKKKKVFDGKQSLTFSILSICVAPSENILAITTTNKKILFFEFTSKKEELKHELNTPTLQKKIWYLPEHGLWVSSGLAEDKKDKDYDKSILKSTRRGESKKNKDEKKITEETLKSRNERFNLYEIEIEFENRNNQKLEVYFDPGGNPFRSILCEHPDEILDVIEIRKPQMILTACMDKIIRLINTNDKTTLITWADHHKSGIRCLDYNYNIGAGYILSVGFEYFINVWSPEVSIKDAFKGKLEGHYSPVIMCKFLSGSPMCVSVDEEGNIRIWDTRKLLCLQLIPQEKKNFRVNKLLSMPKYNKFILYGNKIVFYDPKYRQTDIKPKQQKAEEYFPIRVDFNKYYLNFYVTTQKDVRIYNKDGNLKKVFKNLKNNADGAKIKFFLFEQRNRKFYLGFSSGAIQQFNAGNGSLIKKIGEYEDEKDGISCIKHDHSSDVTNLFFNEEDNILISTGLDSLINIYDESKSEETQKLRTVKGGHKIGDRHNQIFALDFSNHLSLFATGSTDGLITVWDFELSKIDDICYIEKTNDKVMDVYCLKFLEPFPILVSSYSDGSIYFWGVKPNFNLRSRSFMRVKNTSWSSNMKEDYPPVLSMLFIYADMDEISVRKRLKKKAIETSKEIISDQKLVGQTKIKDSMSSPNINIIPTSNKGLTQKNPKDEKRDELNNLDEEDEIFGNFDDNDERSDLELDPKNSQMKTKAYLITGDSKGQIKIYDLRGLIKKFNFEMAPKTQIKSNYNIMKKDDINVESILSHFLNKSRSKKHGRFYDLSNNVLVSEFQAHSDSITSLSLVDKPFCLLSCAKDKKFKIWSMNSELLGEVNIQPSLHQIDTLKTDKEQEWKFRIDLEKLKEIEYNEVLDIYNEIDPEPVKCDFIIDDKDDMNNVQIQEKKKIDKLEPTKKKGRKRIEEIKAKEEEPDDKGGDSDNEVKLDSQSYINKLNQKVMSCVKTEKLDQGIFEMTEKLLENYDSIVKKDDRISNLNMNLNPSNNHYSTLNKEKKSKELKELDRTIKNNVGSKSNSKGSHPLIRDSLYSEKFYSKNNSKVNEEEKKKHSNSIALNAAQQIILPKLFDLNKSQNVKFKKGETERILAYQYYKSSYDACCHIIKDKDISNESLKKNYEMMWNFVKGYSNKEESNKK